MSSQAPPRGDRDLPTALAAIVGLAVALFSFFWAARHPEFPWDGPLLLLGAILLLATLWRRIERAPTLPIPRAPTTPAREEEEEEEWQWPSIGHVPRWRLLLGGVSIVMTLVLLRELVDLNRASYTPQLLLWAGATLAYIVAVAPPVSRPREDWGLWWEVHRTRVAVLVLIVVVAVALRVWNLGEIPATLGGDEGSQGLEAIGVLEGRIRNPFTTGWLGMPTISFYWNSWGIRLLGRTVEGLRLPWATMGVGAVLVTFWLVTRLRGLTLGLITASLLATYHYHIHFSRLGANNIADPFFVGLALLFLYRARDRNSPLDWALAGVVAGVAHYFYPGARLAILLLGLCLLYFFWVDRHRRARQQDTWGGMWTLAGGFLVSAAPMIQYALRFPDNYNARLNEVGIFQSGWLAQESLIRGSTLTVLWEQFLRAILAYNLFPDRTVWYGSPLPLMDGLWAALFLLGLLYAIIRLLSGTGERLFPMVAWWLSTIILGGMLTESPPSTARLIGSAPAACFFVAFALWSVLHLIQSGWGEFNLRQLAPFLVAGVLFLSYQSVSWYFGPYQQVGNYGSRNGEIATSLARYLNLALEEDQRVVFLGPPFLYAGFATIPYLEPRAADAIDVLEPVAGPPSVESLGISPNERPLFVAIPLRADELVWAERAFPGGTRTTVSDAEGIPLFMVYTP